MRKYYFLININKVTHIRESYSLTCGLVAQLVEHLSYEQRVASSILAWTNLFFVSSCSVNKDFALSYVPAPDAAVTRLFLQ
jgi:hypothetical protein